MNEQGYRADWEKYLSQKPPDIKKLKELSREFIEMGMDVASGKDVNAVFIPPDAKVYILAGEHRHAEWFADKIRLPKKQWKYVERWSDLVGASGVVIEYETFWRHPESRRLRQIVDIMIKNGRLVEVRQEDVLHE
jgi:hypothetical protein